MLSVEFPQVPLSEIVHVLKAVIIVTVFVVSFTF